MHAEKMSRENEPGRFPLGRHLLATLQSLFLPPSRFFILTFRKVERLLLSDPLQLKDKPFTWTGVGGGRDVDRGGKGLREESEDGGLETCTKDLRDNTRVWYS